MDLNLLSLALGSSLASGIKLYGAVLLLGLLNRYDMISLPDRLQGLSHGAVLAVALVLFLLEFIADKIPYVDSTWDAIHTFIRVPAGALLAASAFADVPAYLQAIAALVGGTVALTAHGMKASARMAINASPEPFSNWVVSIGEDLFTFFIVWLATHHPIAAIGLAVLFLAFAIWAIQKLMNFLRAFFYKVVKLLT